METSKTIKRLARALAMAQGKFAPVIKSQERFIDRDGVQEQYKYADLADVISATQPALTVNGLSIMQDVQRGQSGLAITTCMMHSSGEFVKTCIEVPIGNFGDTILQALGGSITYARRYALSMLLNIASEDDDGSSFIQPTGNQQAQKPKNKAQPKAPKTLSTQEIYWQERKQLLGEISLLLNGWAEVEKKQIGARDLTELGKKEFDLKPLELLKLRAQCAGRVRGTEKWPELINDIQKQTTPEGMKAYMESMGTELNKQDGGNI